MLKLNVHCLKIINHYGVQVQLYFVSSLFFPGQTIFNVKVLWMRRVWFRLMVFNALINNISIILWRSVLLVEETGVLGENHRPVASH